MGFELDLFGLLMVVYFLDIAYLAFFATLCFDMVVYCMGYGLLGFE